MNMTLIPKKKLFVKFKQFDTELFLISNYKAYVSNNIGIAIWKLLDDKNTISDIVNIIHCDYLQENYDVILNDIIKYLQELSNHELIEFRDTKNQVYEKPLIQERKLPAAVIIS